ncbi:MAG TPA: DNA methyltransferase [Hanamia sp.]|nr:DNA methyltransferase [Hanamia sp.]
MPLSWNEIKSRAITFTNKWKDEANEHAESKSFWDDFFNVFGISRRRVASFEQPVKKTGDRQGFIDLLWKGMILVEHKSRGKDLIKAYQQARDYFPGLTEKELPRYILVSDFERFHLYDLEENTSHEFKLNDFVSHVNLFGFIAGYEKRTFREQDPVNIEAAALMGKLHDKLKTIGYTGHSLELYLVRLLFCLFADDSNIFERGILYDYIDQRTDEDGSDLANHIAQLFEVLNTPKDKRFSNLDESLAAFPYVNGKLFEEHLPIASFDSDMRKLLLECCGLDWGKISPAIFGSLFQSVMNPVERRHLGAHYTSEKNILKLIKPLFLDELWKEFEKVKDSKPKLQKFHNRISELRFLDPACGCGNFLIVAYREIRLLEIEIIKVLLFTHEKLRPEVALDARIDIGHLLKCDVDRFYGIEYEEFPAQIAQVAMWLIDHQMNMKVSETFGEYYVRLPLKKSAVIKNGNALRTDWQSLIEPLPWEKGEKKFDYIFGNPPFVGKQFQNTEQKMDMDLIFNGVKGAGVLDYVSAWYIKAAQYLKQNNVLEKKQSDLTKCAFVSTNSISQGEQVGILWNELFNKYKIKILFAHRTFKWGNEAKGNAAVHVVIIGFANFDVNDKSIFEYENIKSEAHQVKVKNINPYLVEGRDNFLQKRRIPISDVTEMVFGNMPNDGGHLIFTEEEKELFLKKEPKAEIFMRRFIGSQEFINGNYRWCLWLKDASPSELKTLPEVIKRIELVKETRLKSKRPTTQSLSKTPALFGEIRQPKTDYIVFPEVSTERREFIPVGFISKDIITSNKNYTTASASLYLFGILSSTMHMAWIRSVAGRMKSDYSYSTGIVYNNFPWPENPTEKQKQTVEEAAQKVLDVRAKFPESSLADLYDPNTMPPELVKAHQGLDKAVDLCYRPQPFINETKRIEFLFELYDKLTSGMFGSKKKT